MRIEVSACTDTGRKRSANEDFHAVDEKLGLFVVADGLGGHAAGRRASELGVAVFVDTVARDPQGAGAEVLRRAILRASDAIHEASRAEPGLRGMGTTLAAIWLRGDEAALAHAGDSRLYLQRQRRLCPLTLDHSLVGERVARGELSRDQARSHPSRHVITRALGVLPWLEPDVASIRVQAGDLFLLCSDGISSQLEDSEIERCLELCAASPATAPRTLVELANERGGEDNSTALIVAIAR